MFQFYWIHTKKKNIYVFLPDLSNSSQILTNVINAMVDRNDIQAYVICNGEMVILSVMVISTAKYASANSNICANNSIIWIIERTLCKWNNVWCLQWNEEKIKLNWGETFNFHIGIDDCYVFFFTLYWNWNGKIFYSKSLAQGKGNED